MQHRTENVPAGPLAVSVTRAAQILGVSRATTYKLIEAEKLQTAPVGRRNMVRMSSIMRLVEGTA